MVRNRFGDILDAHEAAVEMMRLLNERKQNRINREAADMISSCDNGYEKDLKRIDKDNRYALRNRNAKREFKRKKK